MNMESQPTNGYYALQEPQSINGNCEPNGSYQQQLMDVLNQMGSNANADDIQFFLNNINGFANVNAENETNQVTQENEVVECHNDNANDGNIIITSEEDVGNTTQRAEELVKLLNDFKPKISIGQTSCRIQASADDKVQRNFLYNVKLQDLAEVITCFKCKKCSFATFNKDEFTDHYNDSHNQDLQKLILHHEITRLKKSTSKEDVLSASVEKTEDGVINKKHSIEEIDYSMLNGFNDQINGFSKPNIDPQNDNLQDFTKFYTINEDDKTDVIPGKHFKKDEDGNYDQSSITYENDYIDLPIISISDEPSEHTSNGSRIVQVALPIDMNQLQQKNGFIQIQNISLPNISRENSAVRSERIFAEVSDASTVQQMLNRAFLKHSKDVETTVSDSVDLTVTNEDEELSEVEAMTVETFKGTVKNLISTKEKIQRKVEVKRPGIFKRAKQPKNFICGTCDEGFENATERQIHMESAHEEVDTRKRKRTKKTNPKVEAEKSTSEIETIGNFQPIKNSDDVRTLYFCSQCPQSFKTTKDCRKHMVLTHGFQRAESLKIAKPTKKLKTTAIRPKPNPQLTDLNKSDSSSSTQSINQPVRLILSAVPTTNKAILLGNQLSNRIVNNVNESNAFVQMVNGDGVTNGEILNGNQKSVVVVKANPIVANFGMINQSLINQFTLKNGSQTVNIQTIDAKSSLNIVKTISPSGKIGKNQTITGGKELEPSIKSNEMNTFIVQKPLERKDNKVLTKNDKMEIIKQSRMSEQLKSNQTSDISERNDQIERIKQSLMESEKMLKLPAIDTLIPPNYGHEKRQNDLFITTLNTNQEFINLSDSNDAILNISSISNLDVHSVLESNSSKKEPIINLVDTNKQQLDECIDVDSWFREKKNGESSRTVLLREKNPQKIIDFGDFKKKQKHINLDVKKFSTPFKCKFEGCSSRSRTRESLDIHEKCHTNKSVLDEKQTFSCYVCEADQMGWGSTSLHLYETHQIDVGLYKCSFCSYMSVQRINMKKHVNVHQKDKSFQCKNCETVFCSYSRYKSHVVVHCGEHNTKDDNIIVKSFKCKKCPKRFFRTDTLADHVRNVHKPHEPISNMQLISGPANYQL